MPRSRVALLLVVLSAIGCAVRITPASIADSPRIPPDAARRATRSWFRAVELANAFLDSPFRRTLPPGQFELDEGLGMRFLTAEGYWPITVWSSCTGWLVVLFGFRAQERDGGFVVGPAPPDEVELIDNSMFRTPDGQAYSDAAVADLILHETTHVVFREGTVGVWNTLCYYFEVIFTWRTTDHSAECLPNAVSEEFACFWRWELARLAGAYDPGPFLEDLERSAAAGGDACRHARPEGAPRPD